MIYNPYEILGVSEEARRIRKKISRNTSTKSS